jgi:hypothetical protein
MADTQIWAILVATQHATKPRSVRSDEVRLRETRQLIARARSVASMATTCAVVAPQFLSEWKALAAELPLHNVFTQAAGSIAIDGVSRALRAVRGRDANASVILIPADHCSAIESAWVNSARGALALASEQINTVYLLHDQPTVEDRSFDVSLDFCSSTVIVGSAVALLDLCEGSKQTRVLDLMTQAAPSARVEPAAAINLVHVRLVEEYERIQSGRYHLPSATQVDLTA